MNGRLLRIFVLLWLAWYVWGPLDPVVDYWDSPLQTMFDMERTANGSVLLIAGVFAFAPLQVRKLRDRFLRSLKVVQDAVAARPQPVFATLAAIPIQPIHAPPLLLRI